MYWEVIGNQIQESKKLSHIALTPHGSNWGYNIINFTFFAIISVVIVVEVLNVLRGNSLIRNHMLCHSDNPLMGQTRVIGCRFAVSGFYLVYYSFKSF